MNTRSGHTVMENSHGIQGDSLLPPPVVAPSFSRHSSGSDNSEASNSYFASYLNGVNGPASSSSGHSSTQRLSPGLQASASPDGIESSVSGSPSQSRKLTPANDEAGAPASSATSGSGEFSQSYYDPFRVKHRRRTSPPQLKVLEYHFDRNPKPDVNLRRALSEQLEMTPREVQVWFQNRRAKTKKLKEKLDKEASLASSSADALRARRASESYQPHANGNGYPDGSQYDVPLPPLPTSTSYQHEIPHSDPNYLLLRRGSFPANGTALLPSGSTYYDSAPQSSVPHFRQTSYNTPSNAAGGQFYPPPQNGMSTIRNVNAAFPTSVSTEAPGVSTPSPNESSSTEFGGGADANRKFSLPPYFSGPASTWAASSGVSVPASQAFALPPAPYQATYASPSPDFQPTSIPESAVQHYTFHPQRPRSEVYSDSSTPENESIGAHTGGRSYADVEALSSSLPMQPSPFEQYSFSRPSTLQNMYDPAPARSSPALTPAAIAHLHERRASCPAGFIPEFDQLALSQSYTMAHAYPTPVYDGSPLGMPMTSTLGVAQPQMPLQRRHSLAPTPGPILSSLPLDNISDSSPGSAYLPAPPHNTARRGSTSSALLGTIAEADQFGGGTGGPTRTIHRVRSQRDMGPYTIRGTGALGLDAGQLQDPEWSSPPQQHLGQQLQYQQQLQ